MIIYKEFEVIRSVLKGENYITPQAIYNDKQYYAFKSVDEVKEIIASLEHKGYIANGKVTKEAMDEIAPLKVDNAIILAAGGG